MTKKVYEIIELLEANGWKYIGTRGDHHKFMKEGVRRPVIVTGARSDSVPAGTLADILRESGLKVK